MSSPHPQSEELFRRLLDESAARLAATEGAGIAIPDDDLHREIFVPLLPAMLGDKSIRQHWREQAATGFPARLARHLDGGVPAPRWLPDDFEIHITASYSAGADARALADTLLSEDALREMAAALMNQLLDVLWPSLAPAPGATPAEPEMAAQISADKIPASAEVEIPAPEFAASAKREIPEPIIHPETKAGPASADVSAPEPSPEVAQPIVPVEIPPSATAPERPAETPPLHRPPSRALIRAMCRGRAASALQRGIVANSAQPDVSAAVIARRIVARFPSTPARDRTGRSRRIRAL